MSDVAEQDIQGIMAALARAAQTSLPVNQDLLLALIKGLDEKIGLLINAQKDGVKTAMDAAEKAVAKAETAADKRFEALNELRNMAADWRAEFARQSTVDLQVHGLTDKMENLRVAISAADRKVDAVMARGSGRHDVWLYVCGILAGVWALVATFELLARH